MTESPWKLLSIPLRMESDVVRSRLRVRGLATLLGFSDPDRTRLAAASFEAARHALLHHGGCSIDFLLEDAVPQRFWIEVTAAGRSNAPPSPPTQAQPSPGLASIATARRLLDVVSIVQDEEHLRVRLGQERPARAPPLERGAIQREIQRHLESTPAGDTADELSRQDRELLEALEALRRKSEELSQANLELGLGLPLVHSLVEGHHGSVRAHSEGPGKGTTVEVTLPRDLRHPVRDADRPAPDRSH